MRDHDRLESVITIAWNAQPVPVEPHHLGVHAGFIDEYQPGRIEQALLANPFAAGAHHILALPFAGAMALLLEGGVVTAEKSPQRTGLVRIPRFFKTTINSTNVASGCDRTTSRITVACTSSGETLPPRGFASTLPLSSHRCSHLTAVLSARENPSAASRRVAIYEQPDAGERAKRRSRRCGMIGWWPRC